MNGNGMRRVDRQRRQQRKDVVQEVILDPAALALGDVAAIDQNDADVGQDVAQIAPDRLLIVGELRHRLVDQHELLGGRQSVGAALGDPFPDLGLEAGDPDHEELIKVIGGNRQKSHAFQRGMAGIDRLSSSTRRLKCSQRKLAIDEAFGAGSDRGPTSISPLFQYLQQLVRIPSKFDPSRSGAARHFPNKAAAKHVLAR